MNISKTGVKCPFCGREYVNGCNTVAESLIYFKKVFGPYYHIATKDCKFHYDLEVPGQPYVDKLDSADKFELSNIIDSHPESCILFLCKCPACHKVYVAIAERGRQYYDESSHKIKYVNVFPISVLAQHYGKCVPINIRKDYREACNILELSPQSSATLSRRILEEILDDYFHTPSTYYVKNKHKRFYNLKQKIGMLNTSNIKPKLSSQTISNLNDLRTVGNAGAHLDCKRNKIVPVKKDEALNLLKMVEILIDKTYVENHKDKILSKKLDQSAQVHRH